MNKTIKEQLAELSDLRRRCLEAMHYEITHRNNGDKETAAEYTLKKGDLQEKIREIKYDLQKHIAVPESPIDKNQVGATIKGNHIVGVVELRSPMLAALAVVEAFAKMDYQAASADKDAGAMQDLDMILNWLDYRKPAIVEILTGLDEKREERNGR
jgi:hypothetical protein